MIVDSKVVHCPRCNSTCIVKAGTGGKKSSKQRYLCRDCNRRFVLNPEKPVYSTHYVKCPVCGYGEACKVGKHPKDGRQYYRCKFCNHKFTLENKVAILTEKDYKTILLYRNCGVTCRQLAEYFKCNEKTIRNVTKRMKARSNDTCSSKH